MNRSHLWKLLIIIVVVGWAATEMLPLKSRPLIEVFNENVGKRDGTYSNVVTRFSGSTIFVTNPTNDLKFVSALSSVVATTRVSGDRYPNVASGIASSLAAVPLRTI